MTKISDLSPITSSTIAANDVFPVVDVSQGASVSANVKMTMAELRKTMPQLRVDGSRKTPPLTSEIGSVWTAVSDSPSGTLTVADINDGFSMTLNGSSGWITRHYARPMPTTPYTATLEADPVLFRGDVYAHWGLAIRDASTGRFMAAGPECRIQNVWVNWTTCFSGTASHSGDTGFFSPNERTMPGVRFVRITDNGTTVQASFSIDGTNWYSYTPVSRTVWTANPTQLTFFMGLYNDTTFPLQVVFKDFYLS